MSTVNLCEIPPASKTPAQLSPNTARNHHYIAQTEQRQFAFNPDVNANNQNIYRFDKTDHSKPHGQSVNIDHNLSAQNLYTLAELRDGQQYNMEAWFVRYEGQYEQDCEVLKHLPLGQQTMPEALVRVLKLKWLSLLRNPLNQQHFVVRQISVAWQSGLGHCVQSLEPHMVDRDDATKQKLAKQFGFTNAAYVSWLGFLYVLLSDAVATPSWFERLSDGLIRHPNVRIELLQDAQHQIVFADSGFALQASPEQISVGFGIDPHHWLVCHIPQSHWDNLSQFGNQAAPTAGLQTVTVLNDHGNQAKAFNVLMQRAAHHHVYAQAERRDLLA